MSGHEGLTAKTGVDEALELEDKAQQAFATGEITLGAHAAYLP